MHKGFSEETHRALPERNPVDRDGYWTPSEAILWKLGYDAGRASIDERFGDIGDA